MDIEFLFHSARNWRYISADAHLQRFSGVHLSPVAIPVKALSIRHRGGCFDIQTTKDLLNSTLNPKPLN